MTGRTTAALGPLRLSTYSGQAGVSRHVGSSVSSSPQLWSPQQAFRGSHWTIALRQSDQPPLTGEYPHLLERKGEMPGRRCSLWQARHVAGLELQHGSVLDLDPRLTFENKEHLRG